MNAPSKRAPTDATSARGLTVALLAGGLTYLILAASGGDPLHAARDRGAPLEIGKPIEREIRGGETHAYEITVPAGQVARGVVEQRGVDVALRVVDPGGTVVAKLDSPNGPQGPEPWTIEATGPGPWRLEVSPFGEKDNPGRYEARIDEIISAFEHAERRAKLRYRSPRMMDLWRAHRAEGALALNRFAKEMQGRAPLVEPLEGDARGDVLITFLRPSPPATRYVGLFGAPAVTQVGVPAATETPLLRFEDTDLWYVSLRVPKDLRIEYGFREGEPPDMGLSRKEAEEKYARFAPDEWNPKQFGGLSLIELPSAPPQPWAQRKPGVPEGRVVRESIGSDILGEDRKLGVYLPANFDPARGPYPYVLFFDGEWYGLEVPDVSAPTVLDNLIAEKKVPPMIGVLVANQGTRTRDMAMSAPFCDFLVKELVPRLRREYRAAEAPGEATLAGASLGGVVSTYCALRHPDVFGKVLSQSGAFQFAPGVFDAAAPYHIETGALMRDIAGSPAKPVRFWMEVGLFEPLVAQNRHMRDVLLAKGYDVSYHEYSGGHNFVSWRGSVADGLIALTAPRAAPR